MEINSIHSYFNSRLHSISILSATKSSLDSCLASLKSKVILKFQGKPYRSMSLSKLIKKMHSSIPEIDKNIRKKKLKLALQSKKELEEKLLFVSQSIEGFKQEKSLKKTQQELYDQEKRKAEEFAKEIKKFAKMRSESETILKKENEKLKRKVKALEESDLIQAERMKEKRRKDREIELEKLREKKENREKVVKELQKSQIINPVVPEKKPLFVKIQENFKRNFEIPELEKRKEELKKKSAFFSSIHPETLIEHQKWYNNIRESNLVKQQNQHNGKSFDSNLRSQSLNASIWSQKLIEEEKRAEVEKQQIIEKKRRLLENKARYSELLKELYRPTVSQLKQNSFDGESKKNSKGHNKKINVSASADSHKWTPHKFYPNPMVPPPKAVREPKQVFYLEEQRKVKGNSSEDLLKLKENLNQGLNDEVLDKKALKKIHLNANKLEEIARRKEMMLENKPLTVSLIHQTASVDKMLVNSIKAKIHLLENL